MVKETGNYTGEHSVDIGNKNTFTDWHLVPLGRPHFAPPSVNTSYTDNPGADGRIDLTEALTGFPILGDREGQWEFAVLNGYSSWVDIYSEIANYLHGRRFDDVMLTDDPAHYYSARFTLDDWQSEEARSKIVLKYIADPYKLDVLDSRFTLDDYCNAIDISGSKTITLTGKQVCRKPCMPKFEYTYIGSASTIPKMTLNFSNNELGFSKTVYLEDGVEYSASDILLTGYKTTNVNRMKFTGTGMVSIIFTRGSL